MTVGIIVNPVAGNQRGEDIGVAIARLLNTSYRLEKTHCKEDVVGIARKQALAGCDPIFFIGGDGTQADGVYGIILSGIEGISVLFVPAGRVNDTAKNIGYKDCGRVLRDLKFGMIQRAKMIDIGIAELDGEKTVCFINELGIGIDARITKNVHGRVRSPGILDYFPSLFRELPSLKPYSLNFNPNGNNFVERSVILLVVANNRSYARFLKIDPGAVNDDGLFRLCCIERSFWLKDITTLGMLPFGLHEYLSWVLFLEINKLEISSKEEFVLHYDGEFCDGITKCNILLLPKRIKALVPS